MAETPAIGAARVTFPEAQLRSQRTLTEVRAQASVYAAEGDSPEAHAALKRLSRLLDSGVPLRPNVPRGFYLNFTI